MGNNTNATIARIKCLPRRIKRKIGHILRQYFHFPLPDFMIDKNSDTILALTKSDYEGIGVFSLLKNRTRISSILALDHDMEDMALERHIPFMICEDFLSEDELNDVCSRINYYSSHCLDNIKEVTAEGINFAKLDDASFFLIFNELLFSKYLTTKILSQNKKIITVKEGCDRIYEYYCSDRFYHATSSFKSPNIKPVRGRETPQWVTPRGEWDLNIDIHNKIVIVLIEPEIERHREIIHKLHIRFPGKVCILCMDKYNGNYNEVPIYYTPIYAHSISDTSFLPALSYDVDKYIFDNTLFPYFFKVLTYYCQWRWPNMRQAYLRYKELFQTQTPHCIIGTTINQTELQIPFLAAQHLHIHTYAWGHGLLQGHFSHYLPDTIFVNSEQMMTALNARSKQRIVATSDYTDFSTLYKTQKDANPIWECPDKFKILVLPASCKYNCSPALWNNQKKIGAQISELLNVPQYLKERLDIRFKTHPGFHTSVHYTAKNDNSSSYFFPRTVALPALLDIADCCILLGEDGDAVVHASMRVPTFFCDSNFKLYPLHRSIMRQFPHYHTQISQIWGEIELLIDDPNHRKLYLEQQKGWWAYGETYPTMVDVLQKELNL